MQLIISQFIRIYIYFSLVLGCCWIININWEITLWRIREVRILNTCQTQCIVTMADLGDLLVSRKRLARVTYLQMKAFISGDWVSKSVRTDQTCMKRYTNAEKLALARKASLPGCNITIVGHAEAIMQLVMLLNALRKEGFYKCKKVGKLKIKLLSELDRQLWMH